MFRWWWCCFGRYSEDNAAKKKAEALKLARAAAEAEQRSAALKTELEALLEEKKETANGGSGSSEQLKQQLLQKEQQLKQLQQLQQLQAQQHQIQAQKLQQMQQHVYVQAPAVGPAPAPAAVAVVVRAAAPAAVAKLPAPAAAAPAAAAIKTAPSVEHMEKVVLEVIAEKTGYDVEMVERDASLEDDLGIDSIKRIELLSAIQEILGVEGDREALARTQTVGDVIECLRAQAGASTPVAAAAAPAARTATATTTTTAAAAMASNGPSVEHMEKVVLEVIAEKTGYDVEMVERDASLEDDLGIDSIKRIELLSAIQEILGVEGDREALARTQTVGDVIDCLRAQAGSSSSSTTTTKTSSVATTTVTAATPAVVTGHTTTAASGAIRSHITEALQAAPGVDLAVPELQQIPLPGALHVASSSTPSTRVVVVLDDATALTAEVARVLSTSGHRVVVLSVAGYPHPGLPAAAAGAVSRHTLPDSSEASVQAFFATAGAEAKGVVALENSAMFAREGYAQALGLVVMVAKHCSSALRRAAQSDVRNFFVAVTRLDGHLGLRSRFDDDDASSLAAVYDDASSSLSSSAAAVAEYVQRGAVLGLCKSLDLEWGSVYCRGVDVHPAVSPSDAAACVVGELFCPDAGLREVGYADARTRFTTRAVDLSEAERSGASSSSSRSLTRQVSARFTADDVVLVTGGGRGITPLCLRELSRRVGATTFLLCGRSAYSHDDASLGWAAGVPDADADDADNGKLLQAAAVAHLKRKGEKPTPKVMNKLVEDVRAHREITRSLAGIAAAGGRARYLQCDCGSVKSVEVSE